MNYIARTLEPFLTQAATEFPAVLVTGPRQSGKTTILQHAFAGTHKFVSHDEPDLRAIAHNDPRFFLQQYPPPVVFDEIQYAPELLHYIKRDIDEHRQQKARYLLSGSQNLALMQNVTETLAGHEVDFVLDFGTEIIPVEVKLNATPTPGLAKNLHDFIALFEDRVNQATLVCLTQNVTPLSEKVTAIPFALL